jgi:NADH-quinone oxidoreductase subunit M
MFEVNPSLLTLTIFFPLAWGFLGLFFPRTLRASFFCYFAFLGSLITLVLSLFLYQGFSGESGSFEWMQSRLWFDDFGIFYAVGLDGMSLWLVLLTTFFVPIAILSSLASVQKQVKYYYFLLLALETGMLGVFASLDLFLFYIFWEAMLLPMYFLIGIWGGKERIYASMKFFLYTLVGSLLMLVAIFYLGYEHVLQEGYHSMRLADLLRLKLEWSSSFWNPQNLLFLGFSLAFAIKVPLFPFHTWLPDAHVQAPTAGSVILASVLLKMGGYGFLRFAFPLFPQAVVYFQPLFMGLGAFAIVYGAWVALAQPDMKKLVAYSSVSHMGYVMLGLFSLNEMGMMGAFYQMLNHGVTAGALFLLVGMLYERSHTREIAAFGGLAQRMPWFCIFLFLVTLSAVALPGTNSFIGEFLILLGAWQVSPLWSAFGAAGVIFGAIYMLTFFQKVALGPWKGEGQKSMPDLSFREMGLLIPLVVAIVSMGIFPNFFFSKVKASFGKTHQIFKKQLLSEREYLQGNNHG